MTKFEDFNKIYEDVFSMYKKGKDIYQVFTQFKGDPSDRHAALAMFIMMKSRTEDDINVLAEIQGEGRKTIKAFILEEDRKGNGTFTRYLEDLAVETGAFKGSHVNAIMQESTPYEGDWKCGNKRVVAGLMVNSSEITLKFLIKSL